MSIFLHCYIAILLHNCTATLLHAVFRLPYLIHIGHRWHMATSLYSYITILPDHYTAILYHWISIFLHGYIAILLHNCTATLLHSVFCITGSILLHNCTATLLLPLFRLIYLRHIGHGRHMATSLYSHITILPHHCTAIWPSGYAAVLLDLYIPTWPHCYIAT